MAVSCNESAFELAHPDWLTLGFGDDELAALGTSYLTGHPSERDLATLTALVQRAVSGPWAWASPRPISDVLAAEFAAGDCVLVDGWLLARTEARLCAALALHRLTKPT